MRLIGILLAFVLALAVFRLMVIALCVGLLLIVLWVAVMRPRLALAVIFFGVVGAVAEAYPAITLYLFLIVVLLYRLSESEAKPPR